MPSVGDIMAGRAFVLLYANDTPLYRGLKMAERRVQQFAYNANRIGRSMLTMATAAGAPLAFAARTFTNFQDVMKEVQAVTGATGQEFDKLYEKAKKLGSTTSFTAGQVAEGMANLGRQGFAPDEIDAAIPSVLNLARATKTELAAAATIAAGTLRALGMEAKEMPRVADVLTATANNSSQTLEELGDTMKYAAPIADEMGLSIEQTAKAVGVLANMQIKGTMAGTALRKIMGDLANTDTQEKLREVGVEALNADRSLRPLGDVMVELGQAMAGMTNAERISFAQDLFGERAYGAALKLSKGGFEDLAAAIDQSSGAAERTAALMDSSLKGVMERLKSAAEGVQIAIGESLSKTLKKAGERVIVLLGQFQQWVQENRETVVTVAKVVAGLAAFGAAAIAVGAVAGSIAATINLVSMAISGLTTAITFLAANPMALLLAALVAVGAYMYTTTQHTAKLTSEMNDLLGQNDALRKTEQDRMDQLAELAAKQQLSTTEMQTAKTIIAELTQKYGDLGVKVNETTGAIEALTEAQRAHNAQQAQQAKDDLKKAILEEMGNISELEQEMSADASMLWPWEMDMSEDMDLGESRWADPERRDLEKKRKAIEERHRHLQEMVDRYRRLGAADEQAITGPKADPMDQMAEAFKLPSQAMTPRAIAEQFKAGQVTGEEALKMNQELQDRLAEYRIQRMVDEQDRAIAEINRRYDAERKKAEELGASLSLVEKARKAALDTADEKYAREKAAEKERRQKAADASNARMRDEIARIEIEKKSRTEIDQVKASGGPGTAAKIKEIERTREKQLLELERQRALKDAKQQGLDPALVNELYDARQALVDQKAKEDKFAEIARGRRQLRDAALAPTAQAGSLEAYQAMARHNDPALTVQKNQLRKLNDIEQHTKDAAEKAGVTVIEVGIGDD